LATAIYSGVLLPHDRSAKTANGEQRTLTLPDGSVVRMNVETDLRIDYGSDRRHIQLLSGEAIFKVAPDAGRPFIVSTPSATVRALGTQFNVSLHRQP
jgi:transmembrane sensor